MSQHPISASFSLDSSGIAGFFGGDEAVQAIKTIHLYKYRRWTGWYNAPGGLTVAKSLGPIANSRFWNAMFPGPNECPETIFGLDSQVGPRYIASLSGTIIDTTTHIAYLVTQKSKEADLTKVEGRKTLPMTLTVVNVTDAFTKSKETPTIPVHRSQHKAWLVSIPISACAIACALCLYDRDWFSFAMIFLGIISNGLTCLVVGSASVVLDGVQPATGAPPGDGMLMDDSSNHIVILKGSEKDINCVTKGRFRLEYFPSLWTRKKLLDPEKASRPETAPAEEKYTGIGLCGLLLTLQTLLQILLMPQGTLFGQFMFLASFFISWVYNLFLSSLDKEKVQQDILFQTLKATYKLKYELGTRTAAAVFATLVLRPSTSVPYDAIKLLKVFVPNDTPVWNTWREHVGKHIKEYGKDVGVELESLGRCENAQLSPAEQILLKRLLDDAAGAFKGYYKYQREISDSRASNTPSSCDKDSYLTLKSARS